MQGAARAPWRLLEVPPATEPVSDPLVTPIVPVQLGVPVSNEGSREPWLDLTDSSIHQNRQADGLAVLLFERETIMTARTGDQSAGPSTAVVEGVFDLARDGRTGPLGEMLDAGVPLDLVNGRGDSLLIVAAYGQHRDTVLELLRRGADTAVVNGMGQTALACAVFRGNEAILLDLLAAGADPDLGSHTGIQIADQFALPRMREVIEAHTGA